MTRSVRLQMTVVLALVAMCVCAASAHAAGAVGFGVSPLSVTVEAKPGTSDSYDITLTNTDNKPATFSFKKIDIQGDNQDPDATPVLLDGKQASSISGFDWLSVPAAVTIPATASRKVSVTVTIPTGSTGGHYAAIVVTGPASDVGALSARSQIALPFLMNAGGAPPPEVKVTDVKEFVGGGTKVIYQNNGRTAVKPRPKLHYFDPLTHKEITATSGTCSTALPGGLGSCTFDDANGGRNGAKHGSAFGATGGYVDLVTEQGTRARSELPTEWAGAWSSMLLPLAGLVLAVLYFVFLRRRRREEQRAAQR
ncbi:MAG: hypothetical protein JWN41_137, partial [Thermoleophilia bacterium]|nr:hypothetical protein [Thermoleophilia bacterium]